LKIEQIIQLTGTNLISKRHKTYFIEFLEFDN